MNITEEALPYETYADDAKSYKTIKRHSNTLGLAMPARVASPTSEASADRGYLFITINFSTKQKFKLNRKTTLPWGDYKSTEQYIIISRFKHFCEDQFDDYEIYFEYTKDVNLHIHCIVKTNLLLKDVKIDAKRFFNIDGSNRSAVDVKPVTNLISLREYLTDKKEKTYQITGIPPIIKIKKPIE